MRAAFSLSSKLPQQGTTIFSVMTELAQRHNAINLSQGFPDFAMDERLVQLVTKAMQRGLNQYPPTAGIVSLREQLSALYARRHAVAYDPHTEVTVTSGGTEALLDVLLATISPGDEVLVLEPCYDSYGPAVQLAGGKVVPVPLLHPSYKPNWPAIGAAISPRTRLLLLNFPHNPSGSVLAPADVVQLQQLVRNTEILILSDEVYEAMVYDGLPVISLAAYPDLRERSFIVGSFGKSLHCTGWKVGYCLAPAAFTTELRKVHQFSTFTTSTPFQWAIAEYMAAYQDYLAALRDFYQQKRDRFAALMAPTRFTLLPTDGTYFQLASYARISNLPDREFATWLTEHAGVAVIPTSVFYADGTDHQVVRFCFAKQDSTLQAAAERLTKL